jgi:formate hydrogenlyase transcriptional activator
MRRLVAYEWPGNVRELENVIERAVILACDETLHIASELLATPIPAAEPRRDEHPPTAPLPAADAASIDDVERRHIASVLKQTRWRIDGPNGAARSLGINPSTLRSRIKKLGIRRSGDPS